VAWRRGCRCVGGAALVAGLLAVAPARAQEIELIPLATGLRDPVDIASAGDERLFVVEQAGRIRIVDAAGTVRPTPFLDIAGRVRSGGERGLLGLAFHPAYSGNGFFYVNYTDSDGDSVIARYGVTADPDRADPDSELVLLRVLQTNQNHNGGDLNFSPTDLCGSCLYVGLGDGGGACDPLNDAQDPQELLGKMLRLDVDRPAPHVPPDNPFVGDAGVRDEIWALGLRNPWRFSFDRVTGDMYVADVGQGAWEEIDFQPAGAEGGENYGWDCFEGSNDANCSTPWTCPGATPPVHEYFHDGDRCSITGGFVYRGTDFPGMDGLYVYGDYCTGDLWTLEPGAWNATLQGTFGFGLTTFGESAEGELYAAIGDTIFQVADVSVPFDCPVQPLATCVDAAAATLKLRQAPGDASRNRLVWKWIAGALPSPEEFGDPVGGGTAYRLCAYGSDDEQLLTPGVGARSGWRVLSEAGYRFANPEATRDGLTRVTLKTEAAGSRIIVKGKGAHLNLPALPLAEGTGVVAQLINGTGSCWEAVYPAASVKRDQDTLFKARIP
jgi:glucose/arabinose dehydrogenase